jgi:hypothetical protein
MPLRLSECAAVAISIGMSRAIRPNARMLIPELLQNRSPHLRVGESSRSAIAI